MSTGDDVTTLVGSFDDDSRFDISKNEIETSRGEVSTLENPFTAYNKGKKRLVIEIWLKNIIFTILKQNFTVINRFYYYKGAIINTDF